MPINMSDQELWESLRAGEPLALERIYREHAGALLRYGQKFLPDTQLVEDSLQDLFVELWKNRAGLGPNNAIRKYLFVALRRKLLRNLQPLKKLSSAEPEEQQFKAEFSIDEQLMAAEYQAEKQEQLQEALDQLSERQREVLYLKYFAELDYPEICEIMDINYQSVRNLAFRALQTLRELMTLLVWNSILIFLGKN